MENKFNYKLEESDIIDYMMLTPEDKLEWLGDIFTFTEETDNEQTKKIRNFFREENT
jgi:hypothetical protein